MAFLSKEMGRLLGSSAINWFSPLYFLSGRLPCVVNFMA